MNFAVSGTADEFLDELERRATHMKSPFISNGEWDRLDELHGVPMGSMSTTSGPMFYAIPGDGDLWHLRPDELLAMVNKVRAIVAARTIKVLLK